MTDPATADEAKRAFARRLAAESISRGDVTGWFETLYLGAAQGTTTVPWADLVPQSRLVAALADRPASGRALVIGCGLGDDAEHVSSLGYATVAFDVSPTAILMIRRRFPQSTVDYVVADLLKPPPSWAGAFDLVVEAFTLQVLTGTARHTGFARVADFVAPGGRLLVIAGAREETDHPGRMPWPLTRAEMECFCDYGLRAEALDNVVDDESGLSVRRWLAWFRRDPHGPAEVSRRDRRPT